VETRQVFNHEDVEGFSPKGFEDTFVSRMLVDKTSVGSERLTVNHFTLRPGKHTDPGSHPPPFDELYYVVSGTGWVDLGSPAKAHAVKPGTVVFIPCGTDHALRCDAGADLEVITIMPAQPVPGANPVYDARLEEWGTSFRMVER
jgi:quercetin dioxygenase-like cupin family protein